MTALAEVDETADTTVPTVSTVESGVRTAVDRTFVAVSFVSATG